MSEAGFKAREYAIEWHAELWRRYGTPEDFCRRMLEHCIGCLLADYDGDERPETDDPYIAAMQAYLDRVFSRENPLVSFA